MKRTCGRLVELAVVPRGTSSGVQLLLLAFAAAVQPRRGPAHRHGRDVALSKAAWHAVAGSGQPRSSETSAHSAVGAQGGVQHRLGMGEFEEVQCVQAAQPSLARPREAGWLGVSVSPHGPSSPAA